MTLAGTFGAPQARRRRAFGSSTHANPHSRRPRTLIMTTVRKGCPPFANQLFLVTREHGIRYVGPAKYDMMQIA